MNKDLREIQKLWERFEDEPETAPNLVLFFQKELFHSHFLFGKMIRHEKTPPEAKALADYFSNLFRDHPFEADAVLELARLSRGIFRRFKKYVQICLENLQLGGKPPITFPILSLRTQNKEK